MQNYRFSLGDGASQDVARLSLALGMSEGEVLGRSLGLYKVLSQERLKWASVDILITYADGSKATVNF